MSIRVARLMVLCAAAWAAAAASSFAQVAVGRIDVSVADWNGTVLPNATVAISGPQSRSAVTDRLGEAHFLNLEPGTYTVRAKLSGFSDYLNRKVPVVTGASLPLRIALGVAGVATQVQVTNQTPVIDVRNTAISTIAGPDELQNIPSSRDPWGVLRTVPGVILDRVNVGGADAGRQPDYQAKGAAIADNTWNLDGITITDMAVPGTSPAYYDFDMFQEMQVTTGGADLTSATPGVQSNLVLKSGSNTARGGTRLYFENEDLQGNNIPADLAASIGGTTGKGDRTHQYKDYGFEIGGPLVKDRLWGWGGLGRTHVDLITLSGGHDRTVLTDGAFKVTGQATSDLRASFTYFHSLKEEFGRGAGPTRPSETTYDERSPVPFYKGEANVVTGGRTFVSVKAGRSAGAFTLVPEGSSQASIFVDDRGVQHNTADTYITRRPQNVVSIDGSSFYGRHELKFGVGWRRAESDSTVTYPGNGIITYHAGYPEMEALLTRDYALKSDASYWSGYAADTITFDRATLNLGLRWDRQIASLGAATVPANAAFPDILPATAAAPVNRAITWNSIAPRLGLTYALDADRKYLLRATYASFASQLASTAAGVVSPIQYAGIYYVATDVNGNQIADPGEVKLGLGNLGFHGFDPANPAKPTSDNRIGDYATPTTREVTVGADHELALNFGLTATLTYRRYTHFDWNSLTGVNARSYSQAGTLTGNIDPVGSFSVPLYARDPNAVPAGGGTSFEERKGYHQRYLGFEAAAVKRLSNHWLARFGFSTNAHREYFDGPDALDDPTPSPSDPRLDGGLVVTPAAGSGNSTIYLVLPRYQFSANGMYQLGWGINVSANWLLRQGYAEPYFTSDVITGDPLSNGKSVLITPDVGEFRLPHLSLLDARLEKAFTVRRAAFALDLDVFNVTNGPAVLGRQYDARLTGASGFNQTLEIMNPRIWRLGARVSF